MQFKNRKNCSLCKVFKYRQKIIAIDSLFLARNNPNDSHTTPIVGATINISISLFLGKYSGKLFTVPYDWVIEFKNILNLRMADSIVKETIKLTTIIGMENRECGLFVDNETKIILLKDNKYIRNVSNDHWALESMSAQRNKDKDWKYIMETFKPYLKTKFNKVLYESKKDGKPYWVLQ